MIRVLELLLKFVFMPLIPLSSHTAKTSSYALLSACLLMAPLLSACGSVFKPPFREEGVIESENPYPEFANIGEIESPLISAQRARTVSGVIAREGDALAGATRDNQDRANATAQPTGPSRNLDPGEIANIPADGASVQSAQSRAETETSLISNRKKSAEQRKAEIEQAKLLRQATVDAVNAERKRAIDEQNRRIEARNAQIRERQRLQQLRNQEIARQRAEFEARRAEFEKRKAEFEQRRNAQIANLTNIPEPTSNDDLFAIKGQEQVAIIYFDEGKPRVSDSDLPVLREAANLLRAKGGKLLIVGHASPPADGIITKENREANIRVSKARTEAVAIQLRKIGVPLELMQLEALADTKPVYGIKSANGQSGNRRVEIYRITADSVKKANS